MAEAPSWRAHLDDLARQVEEQVPTEPGCYLWKSADGEILYVGKAKNLRARMRQYVGLTDERAKIPLLMAEAASFDYVTVASEHEALLLEMNLIQRHHPRYNVSYMDDKSYPFIAITEGDVFPAIKYTRERHKPATRYFGPYTDARSARQAIDVVRKVCPLCVATCAEWKRLKRRLDAHPEDENVVELAMAATGRPCFDFHVGRGPGPCAGEIGPEAYAENVAVVEGLLTGRRSKLKAALAAEIQDAADDLDFERAARYKRRLDAVAGLEDRQQVILSPSVDADVVGIYREETICGVCVFAVREGRVVRSVEFVLDKGLDIEEAELVGGFLKRYYEQTADVPLSVEVPCLPEDPEAISAWLSGKRGRRVELHVPVRGRRRKLMDTAVQNARHYLVRHEVKTGYEDSRTNQALLELESALALPGPPLRMECFDISTIHGKHTVASMVVFTNGKPDKSQYRRFKIRTPLSEANDFLSMGEALARRYSPERMADERFGKRPDLLVLDGGKPQLTAALNQLADLELDVPVCGLAKADEELIVPWDDLPVVLPNGSASLYLVKRLRDEAHRFAITFHRELRGKAMTVSILDEIEGVGPKRKKALRKAFPSMAKLRVASLEEIAAVPGIPHGVAREVYETLRAWERELAAEAPGATPADGAV